MAHRFVAHFSFLSPQNCVNHKVGKLFSSNVEIQVFAPEKSKCSCFSEGNIFVKDTFAFSSNSLTCEITFKANLHYELKLNSNQNVTFLKILQQMNIRIYSYQQIYTNEYPNIFILFFLTQTNVRISIRIENCMNIRIYSNIRLGFTL